MLKLAMLGLIAGSLSGPALAQSIPDQIADGMYVTVDEVRAKSVDTFEFFAGPDGGLIKRERFVSTDMPNDLLPDQPEEALLERLFGLLDANGDGQITLSEWRSRINRDLEFADQNGDGQITLQELSNARQNMSFGESLGMIF